MNVMKFLKKRYIPGKLVGASPLTIESYQSIVRQFNAWHIDVHGRKPQIGRLDRSLLGEYMSHLSKAGKAPSTINKARGHLVALWNWAHIEGLHSEKPSNVAKVKEPKRSPEAWTLEQLGNILKSAGECEGMVGDVPANVLWLALIWTAFNSGARVSAMMSIRWDDVDLESGWLKIRAEYQKHKEDQQVGLMPETIESLQRLAEYPRADETVFGVWRSDRTCHGWKRLNMALRKILKRAGLPHGRRDLWHKIRRTFATQVNASGGLAMAQTLLGHSSADVTMRYIDPRQAPKNNQADYLGRPTIDVA
jgi:integrase